MSAPYDPRLFGSPDRYSPALDAGTSDRFDGLVKLRLGHAAFGSMLLPELMFIKLAGWRFYQPSIRKQECRIELPGSKNNIDE